MTNGATAGVLDPSTVPGIELAEARARQLAEEGRAKELQGDPAGALGCYEAALTPLLGRAHHPVVAELLYRTGVVRSGLGQTPEAEEIFHQSLEVAAWCQDLGSQAYAVNGLAVVEQRRGDLRRAESLFRRAARLASEAADFRLVGMVEQNLGVLANIRGDLDSALVHYRKSQRAFEQAADNEGLCWVLNNMGMLQTDVGRYADSEQTLTRGLELARERGDLVMETLLELNRSEALIGLESWAEAGVACDRALAIAEERSDPLHRAEGLKYRAVIHRETDDPSRSVELLEEAHALAVGAEDALLGAEILKELGESLRRMGEVAGAVAVWERAVGEFRDLDATLDAAGLEGRLAELAGEDA